MIWDHPIKLNKKKLGTDKKYFSQNRVVKNRVVELMTIRHGDDYKCGWL